MSERTLLWAFVAVSFTNWLLAVAIVRDGHRRGRTPWLWGLLALITGPLAAAVWWYSTRSARALPPQPPGDDWIGGQVSRER